MKLEGKDLNLVILSYTRKTNFSSSNYFVLYKVAFDGKHPLFGKEPQENLNNGKHPWNERLSLKSGFWTINVNNRSIKPLRLSNKDELEIVRYYPERDKSKPQYPFRLHELKISDSLYDSLPIVSLEE